jgi:hypothetical protein
MSGWGLDSKKPKQKHYVGKTFWVDADEYAPIEKGKFGGTKK